MFFKQILKFQALFQASSTMRFKQESLVDFSKDEMDLKILDFLVKVC